MPLTVGSAGPRATRGTAGPAAAPPDSRGLVLGVDPGLAAGGYGLIGPPEDGRREPCLVVMGEFGAPPREPLEQRLLAIYRELLPLLRRYRPTALALEELHSRYRFPGTGLLMAHARGAIALAAGRAGVPVFHYSPTRVKSAVAGYGGAAKEMVQRAVQQRLSLPVPPASQHCADALALALCHWAVAGNQLSAVRGGERLTARGRRLTAR